MGSVKDGCVEKGPEATEGLAPPLGFEAKEDHVTATVVHIEGGGVSVEVLLP